MKYPDFRFNMNFGEWILLILFILYYILGEPMPSSLGVSLSSNIAKIIIVLIALCLFGFTNIYVAVFGLFVAYSLITNPKTNSYYSSSDWSRAYPSQKNVWSPYTPTNQFPKTTLEEEMVKKMTAPAQTKLQKQTYKNLLNNTNNAAPVNYGGVI